MAKFKVGDMVQMPGVPFVVEALEIGVCEDQPCDLGGETFRFKDPGRQGDDWGNAARFEQAA